MNREGSVIYVNDFAASQFGPKPEDIIGKRQDELFPHEAAEAQRDNVEQVLKTGLAVYAERILQFPGREMWSGTRLTPVKDSAGEVTAVFGISRDISDRKKAEEEREDFIRTVSHDLRAPLTVIQGQAQVLQRIFEKSGTTGYERRSVN